MSRSLFSAAWWLFCVLAAASAVAQTELYVAPAGSDDNPGTQQQPFGTLEKARDAIRTVKHTGGLPKGGVTVWLQAGIHQRTQPLQLTADDSGTAEAPIVYAGAAGAEVRLSGGSVVADWKPVDDPSVLERLDEAARANVLQADLKALGITDYGAVKGGGLELFFDDVPMTLARWPNEGFVEIVDLLGGQPFDVRGTKGDRVGKFVYQGDRPSRWIGEQDPWVHGYWFWDWSDQRQAIAAIDAEKHIIEVKPPYHNYGYRKGQWFYALNLLGEIDRPGEWYLDRERGLLYFWPTKPIGQSRAVVSVAGVLIETKDCSHVTLRGLIVEAGRAEAVRIRGGGHCTIERCLLRNLGGSAVSVGGGTDHRVARCEIHGCGNGGIRLSGGDRKTLAPARHEAVNNHIHHYGRWNRMYQSAVALNGVGLRAAHNLIHDAPHIGISFGGNDHLIELNEMHHIVEESNDAGAMYAGRDWTARGTVIRHNFLHDINGFRDRGCVGVYLDDMFSGTEISGNVFYDVYRAAFIGGGRDNAVTNNIFVNCTRALHIDARALGWAAYSVPTTMTSRLKAMPYEGEPWRSRYPRLPGILDDEPAAPKGNVVERNVFVGPDWNDVHAAARPFVEPRDNLTDVDPGFIDAAEMNFQLRDDSPVYEKLPGFQKIPFKQIGLQGPVGP